MQDKFDILIRNASIVDGTGAPRYAGDIGIRGDRIARIGDLSAQRGRLEIDLGGRIAAPGFIDAHTHDDRLMLSNPDMAPKVSQGITTVVGGQLRHFAGADAAADAAAGDPAAEPAGRGRQVVLASRPSLPTSPR